MNKKYWFPCGSLRNRVGFITDIYDEYVEIQEEDTNEFYIVLFNLISEANG